MTLAGGDQDKATSMAQDYNLDPGETRMTTEAPNQTNEKLRRLLVDRYGSIKQASRELAVDYFRLRKAVDRSRISIQDFEAVFPGTEDNDAAAANYGLELYKGRCAIDSPATGHQELASDKINFALDRYLKKAFRPKMVGSAAAQLIRTIFDSLGPRSAAVTFFDHAATPAEWSLTNSSRLAGAVAAVQRGATLIYVTPAADILRTIRKFETFLTYLRRQSAPDGPVGDVFLLVVEDCSYCTTSVNWSLLGINDNDQPQHFALAAIELTFPMKGTINTKGVHAIAPQDGDEKESMINEMMEILWNKPAAENIPSDSAKAPRLRDATSIYSLKAHSDDENRLNALTNAFHAAFYVDPASSG